MKRLEIGVPLVREVRQFPDLIVKNEDVMGTKAPENGVYELNGKRFKTRKGAVMPEGATFEARAQAEAPEDRALDSAPQNKSMPKAANTKSDGGKKD